MRKAFTLIELLIVVAILGVLLAITMAISSRIITGQKVADTRQLVTVLQLKVDRRATETIERAKKSPYRYSTLQYCGGDQDRATAVLCYAYLRIEFPESFAEARQGFRITDGSGSDVLVLAPLSRFVNVPVSSTAIPGDQAAALLFIAINDVSDDWRSVGVDDATQLNFYKDSYGKPVFFVRWYEDGKPRDPLDPMGKLTGWASLPVLQAQAGCTTIGDGMNKRIVVRSNPQPDGDILWGFGK